MKEVELVVGPDEGYRPELWKACVARQTGIPIEDIGQLVPLRRSMDARGKRIKIHLRLQIFLKGEQPGINLFNWKPQSVVTRPEVHIVGCGPAGLFAALRCIELGLKPVILERGKNIRDRRRDLVSITRHGMVSPDSNYCFGEGGAGTYSDGKLYTRSSKRGNTRQILQWLVQMGAHDEILFDAHPHIGTNRLPAIITEISRQIKECGGEIHFSSRLTGLRVSVGKITGLQVNNGVWISVNAVLLATGHSARDIFEMLQREKIKIEYKSFALGVRVEHNQALIDELRYHCTPKPYSLPHASYSWVEQVNGLGVYSFCMCPGGIIAPCATAPGEVVTNGWSPSGRNNRYANSGIVVTVNETELSKYGNENPLKGMQFQRQTEQEAFKAGGENLFAPAQRLVDFCERKTSSSLPPCSYLPGIATANLHHILPDYISNALIEGFKRTAKKLKGYFTNEAVITAVESRTSSPVRIPRNAINGMHTEVEGFFPCGEGAGYAGGIVSAAMDGLQQAENIFQFFKNK